MQINYDAHFDVALPAAPLEETPIALGAVETHLPYFSATSRRTTLDMALYLARYSDLVLLIHGPAGSGKSTLLREMIARGGPNIHAITVSADRTLTTQMVCDAVLNSFKLVAMPTAAGQSIAQIKEQLDLLQRKGYHCIVFIDDADHLANDAYSFLETLADLRGDAGRNLLNLVLFAQQREKITLLGPSVRHRVKATELRPLAADETAAYIQHVQHNRRGNSSAVDFQDREIRRIARASSGWPGNINALIAQRSAHHASHPSSFLLNYSWATPRYLLGAMSIAAALVFVFVFQDSINQWFETPPIVSHAVTELPQQAPAPVAEVASAVPTEVSAPSPSSLLAASVEAVVIAPEAEQEPAAPIAQAIPVDPPTPPPTAASRSPTKNKPQRHDWLLAQNPEAYTLQIAGSSQEGDIRRALKKYSLTDPAAVFSASRKGKPWFGLVTGVYADFASAKQARAALPEELMRGTWVRRLRAVQSEINKPQEAAEATEQPAGTAAATSPTTVQPIQLP